LHPRRQPIKHVAPNPLAPAEQCKLCRRRRRWRRRRRCQEARRQAHALHDLRVRRCGFWRAHVRLRYRRERRRDEQQGLFENGKRETRRERKASEIEQLLATRTRRGEGRRSRRNLDLDLDLEGKEKKKVASCFCLRFWRAARKLRTANRVASAHPGRKKNWEETESCEQRRALPFFIRLCFAQNLTTPLSLPFNLNSSSRGSTAQSTTARPSSKSPLPIRRTTRTAR